VITTAASTLGLGAGVLADLAARSRAAGTGTTLIDLAVLALRINNRQVAS
jgi:hypothetical protein